MSRFPLATRVSHLTLAAALALAPLAGPPSPAHARIVYDPTNYAQNVLQAARALQQVNNQIRQIELQVQSLKRLDLQLAPEVGETIAAARELFGQAQAIRYNLGSIAEEVRALSIPTISDRSASTTCSPAPTLGSRKAAPASSG